MAPKSHYPLLRMEDFEGMDNFIIKDVAHILGRSWWTVRGAIIRLGIRDRFPAWGGHATQIAMKGYDHDRY